MTDEPKVRVYRCLRDFAFADKSEADAVELKKIERRMWIEQDLIRQALDTPHAILNSKLTPAHFEFKDYRIVWEGLRAILPYVPVNGTVDNGVLLAKLAMGEAEYFGGNAGLDWIAYVKEQAPPSLEYALGEIVPRLYARHQMLRWKQRSQHFIEELDEGQEPMSLHASWRQEAYQMSLAHDGGAVGKSVSQMVAEWDPTNRENRNIVRLGIDQIDKPNGGGHGRGELMVIGGGTSHGKSYAAQRIMRLQAQLKQRALYISVEDNQELFTARMFADYSIKKKIDDGDAIPPVDIRDKSADPDRVEQLKLDIAAEQEDRLYFFQAKKWTVSRICDVIRRYRYLCGVDLVIVDYLQAISPDEVTNLKANDTALIVAQLKACCTECEVALVLLSQYARDEYRNGLEPTIVSCKWAGEIENESEIMLLLWRDEQDVLHAKIAKLKWAKAAGRRYTIKVSETTGCMGDWIDDFTPPASASDRPQRRRGGRNGNGNNNGGNGNEASI